jgi:hypothetical protein
MIQSSGKKVREGNLLKTDFENLTNFLFENNFITNKPQYVDFYKDLK